MDAAVLRSVIDAASDAIVTVDGDQVIRLFNRAAADLFGWGEAEILGRPLSVLLPPSVREGHASLVESFGDAPGVWRRMTTDRPTLSALHRDGREIPVDASISAVVVDGRRCFTAILRDVSHQRAMEATLRRLSLYDPVTELPNRALLMDRLNAAICSLGRTGDVLAVFFVDVDRFKRINDALGHQAGDALLSDFAARLRAGVRRGDMVGRFAGDEFLVIARCGTDQAEILHVADRLRSTWDAPFIVEGHVTKITASIGIGIARDAATSGQSIVENADEAMYRAKQQGRNGVELYDPARGGWAGARLDLERDLAEALARGELEVHYQPVIDLQTGAIVGTEALARWRRAGRLVPPVEFIPIAEDTGLITEIGEYVLRQACDDTRDFARIAGRDIRIAVNLSLRQVTRPGFGDTVAGALEWSGLPAEALTLEITESFLLDDPGDVLPTLNDLRRAGVRLALDDFGTGYSSLSHLRTLPVTTVKIDRSFMAGVTSPCSEDRAIVTAVLAMARALSLQCVVEGVETPQQAEALTDLGAEHVQGYLYSPPVPAAQLAAMLGDPDVPRQRSGPPVPDNSRRPDVSPSSV
jgi:diguanylate cyclase (GGDEF)-like protein/PAS domain S-box-containing protein